MSESVPSSAPLILASASAGRAQILTNANLRFEQRPADIDERAIERDAFDGEGGGARCNPGELALELSYAKALAVSAQVPDALVIGADQVLACGGRIFHKPATMDHAQDQLRELRGRVHSLYAGISVARSGEDLWQFFDRADLTMREFSDDFLDNYCRIEGDRMLATVGSYRIEGPGAQLFSRISGDFFTIIGLPLLPLLGYLRETGWLMR